MEFLGYRAEQDKIIGNKDLRQFALNIIQLLLLYLTFFIYN